MKLLLVLPFLAAAAAARSTRNNASPVLVELYYESYCPDCRQYIQGELQRTWQKLGKTGMGSKKSPVNVHLRRSFVFQA